MNKILNRLLFGVASILALAHQFAFAQTIVTPTTLSAAVTSVNHQKTFALASCTGISAPGVGTGTVTEVYIDKELSAVEAVLSTSPCVVTVGRGQGGTVSTLHASGALVFYGPPGASGPFFVGLANVAGVGNGAPVVGGGACTRNQLLYLPMIDVATGVFSDCLGGVWVSGTQSALPPSHVASPIVGGIAVTSLTAGVAMPATDMSCTEANLPSNKLLTGIGLLNGATASTDNHLVALYDATGHLLANSATAGVLAAGASDYQYIPFTAKFYAVGPAQYYACYQTNGTTGLVHMVDSATGADPLWAGYIGTQTFGTIPATITVPTTFTTAQGVMVAFY